MDAIVRYLDSKDINKIKKAALTCDIKNYIDFNIDDIDDSRFYIGIFKYNRIFIGLCTIGSVIGIDDYKKHKKDCILSNVYIIPKYREFGYASQLINYALVLANHQYGDVYCHIDILDQNLVSFYRNIGFIDEACDNNNIYTMKIDISNLKENKNYFDWIFISKYMDVSDEFIKNHADKLDWKIMQKYHNLPESIIEKYSDKINWDYISENSILTEDFINKHSNKVNWDNICKYQKLSESFIEKYKDKVNWEYVSWNQNLSEDFIIKYIDRVHWSSISATKTLSTKFIKEFFDYIDWNTFFYFRCKKYCISFIINMKDNLTKDQINILEEKLYLCNEGEPEYITVNLNQKIGDNNE